MEAPAKTALGGSAISALAVGGLVAVAAAAGMAADPASPPARAATGLTAFRDCAALKQWYVDHTIDQVGAYGWDGRAWTTRGRLPSVSTGTPAESADPAAAVTGSATGTNTQEAGIDEPDVAKTDGRIVVRLVDGRRLVLTDVSGAAPRDLSTWVVPASSYVDGLLLVGDHVLLSGDRPPFVVDDLGTGPGRVSASPKGSHLIDLDISDPGHPRLDSDTTWSGDQLSLRQYGDTVRLVTATGLPELAFVQPGVGGLSVAEAEERNREIVRESSVRDWLPSSSSAGRSTALLGCADVYHPATWSGSDTVAVATFRPGAVGSASAVAVTAAGSEVYSSRDRLYVTATQWGRPLAVVRPLAGDVQSLPTPRRTTTRTSIHAFALDGSSTRYVASGTVDGTIRDRWSLDEHDGHLRVAVTWPGAEGQSLQSGIVVLDEQGGELVRVGELRGLGVDEQVQSVRWYDDLAVVVTFRQTDPLHTVDLTDPTRPRLLGDLVVPGFSSYLHPIGGDRLLGLGTAADTQGLPLGAQAGVFDLSDPTRTRQVGRVAFAPGTVLGAAQDPHAFTWLPGASAAITSLTGPRGDGTPTLVLLRVAPTGVLTREALPSPGGRDPRALPLEDGRVALVGDQVRLVTVS